MADDVDLANAIADRELARALAARRPEPMGWAGECWQCGWDAPRLVGGRCAPCRDRR